MPDIVLDVGLNLAPSDRAVKQLGASLNTTLSRANNPLGKISASFREFDKSLEASNARVLAFGASAGIILGVQRAMAEMVKTTINVEKSLTDINVILGLNTRNLQKFGSDLFQIAKQTGQTFDTVASAATELSRQGLGVEQTLRRTKDALILTRQSGLEVVDSVNAITAALNSFNKTAIDSTGLINKLANVDAQYAVSSADLAEAIKRVGSSAQDAGVSLDELLGLVTAIQQRTARGGAVIGNALKSVFARISRPDSIEQLRELGVNISATQTGMEKLRNLSSALKNAGPALTSTIKELSGGVYQINIVSAALSELQNEYNTVASATQTAANATDQATRRNEELNKTLSALSNKTLANLQEVGSQFGKLTIGPALETAFGTINELLEGAISKSADNAGEILGKGLLKGVGQFLTGPGFFLIGTGIVKLVSQLAKEFKDAAGTVLGWNKASQDQLTLQSSIHKLLMQHPTEIAKATSSAQGYLQVQREITSALERESLLLSQSVGLSQKLAANVAATAGLSSVKDKSSVVYGQLVTKSFKPPTTKGSPGFAKSITEALAGVPSFANPISSAIAREHSAGVPMSLIRVGTSPKLAAPHNPFGIGIYNTKDEPLGLSQGISRAASMGINPKTHGLPNFAFEDLKSSKFGTKLIESQLIPTLESFRQQIIRNEKSFKQLTPEIRSAVKGMELLPRSLQQIEMTFRRAENLRAGTLPSAFSKASERYPNYPRRLEGNELVRTRLQRKITPQEAALLRSGSLDINTQQPKLLNAPQTGFVMVEKDRGFRGNLLGYTPPAERKLLKAPNVITPPYNPPTPLNKNIFGQAVLPNLTYDIRQAQLSKKLDTLISGGVFMAGYGKSEMERRKPAPPPPTFNERITSGYGRLRSSENMNKLFLASFLAPTVGGMLSEGIGSETRGGRIAGAGVQGIANIGGYAAMSTLLTKNPYAAAGITALTGAMEVKKFIQIFNDNTPELEKSMQQYKESIDKNNENLQGVISGTDMLKQIRSGETAATPYQYREILQNVKNRTSQLLAVSPENRTEMSKAMEAGDYNTLEKIIGQANRRSTIESRGLELQKQVKPFERDLLTRLSSPESSKEQFIAGIISGLPGQSGAPLFRYRSNLNKDIQSEKNQERRRNINSFVGSFLSQTDLSGKNLYSLFSENYKANKGSGGLAGELSGISGLKETSERRSGLIRVTDKIEKEFNLLPIQTKAFRDFIANAGESDLAGAFESLASVSLDAQKEMDVQFDKFFKSVESSASRFNELSISLDIFKEMSLLNLEKRYNQQEFERTSKNISRTGGIQRQIQRNDLLNNPFGSLNLSRKLQLNQSNQQYLSDVSGINQSVEAERLKKIAWVTESLQKIGLSGLQKGTAYSSQYENEAVKRLGQIFGLPTQNFREEVAPNYDKIISSGYPKEVVERVVNEFNKTGNLGGGSLQAFERLGYTQKTGKTLNLGGGAGTLEDIFSKLSSSQTPQEIEDITKRILEVRREIQSTLNKNELPVSSPLRSTYKGLLESTSDVEVASKVEGPKRQLALQKALNDKILRDRELQLKIDQDRQRTIEETAIRFNEHVRDIDKAIKMAEDELNYRNQINNVGKTTQEILDGQITRELTLNKLNEQDLVIMGKSTGEMLRQVTLAEKFNKIKQQGSLSGKDLKEVISANLTYTREDQWNEILTSVDDVTKTMKQGFKDSFMEFTTGAKNAKDAMRDLGLTIAKEVLSKVTSIAFNSLFNAIGGLGSAYGAKRGSTGGYIGGYASGGMVRGGSGVRDDIPMMLNKGSYVIRKSAVSKYGAGMLGAINSGVGKYAIGGGVRSSLRNEYSFNNELYPTSGSFDVDPRLSALGQTDENNPQNDIKFGREQGLISYQNTIRQYKAARKNYKSAKVQSFIGSIINAISLIGGAKLGQMNANRTVNGGNMTRTSSGYTFTSGTNTSYGNRRDTEYSAMWGRAAGGYSRDNIPALLTGGEFIMSKPAVDRVGVGFMNRLNSGAVPKYQGGGLVGRDSTGVSPTTQDFADGWKQIVSAVTKLIGVSEEIRDGKGEKTTMSPKMATDTPQPNATNNTVNINISYQDGKVTNSSADGSSDNKDKTESLQQLADMMKNVALDTIVKQQRPGGLLQKTR